MVFPLLYWLATPSFHCDLYPPHHHMELFCDDLLPDHEYNQWSSKYQKGFYSLAANLHYNVKGGHAYNHLNTVDLCL